MAEDAAAVVEHIPGLRRYARSLMGDSFEAEDLVQECLTKALSRITLFSHARNERAYLYSILHNLHVDRLARNRRSPIAVSLETVGMVAVAQPTQQGCLEIRDLQIGLAGLPAEQREAVILVGLKGKSYKDVAEITGVPVGTVMSRLSRGRESLRRYMATGAPEKPRRAE